MNKKLGIRILGTLFLFSLFFVPYSTPVLAQTAPKATEYKLLAPIPLTESGKVSESASTATYIPGLFRLMIAIATGLAVLMLIYAGIKYMSTDAFTGKEEAKGIIENALWGLLLAISAWLIVATIDPKLVSFNLSIPIQEIKGGLPSGGIGTGGGNCIDCVNIKDIAVKTGACGSSPCSISPSMAGRLTDLNSKFPFRITEAYPPTRAHEDPCHAAGTCIDATISLNSATNVKKFISDASASGLNAKFEVLNQGRYTELVNAGVPSANIMINASASGEHFHIK